MRKIIYLMFVSLIIGSCKQNKEEVDSNYVISQFEKNSKEIEKVEYQVQRIDTFPSGDVWNKKGFAMVEKNENDENFGYHFYGKRNDFEKGLLYENGKGVEIDTTEKNYELISVVAVPGSPGGQMVVENIFHLDSIYKNVELIEKKNSYLLKYTLEPATVYDTTASERIVELRKPDFFPIKITYRAKKMGRKHVIQQILSDIKTNSSVNNSLSDYKDLVSSYDLISPTDTTNSLY
ncbi:MAG: hypothetical protein R3259_02715 [Salinimicrobium sediminis]|nr:hypothetical protein [Salinimicrobium sediminis]